MDFKRIIPFFLLSRFEKLLYFSSLAVITISFVLSKDFDPVVLIASLTGATALIFVAKGQPCGQVLTVVFALIYGYISFTFRYYGEMITYLGMTSPIAAAAVVSWIKNPYEKGKTEVKVNKLSKKTTAAMWILAAAVTAVFYFILKFFDTPNLFWSTVSITTSFVASYFTLLRSPFYALAYAANDVILIILWTLASAADASYIPMVVCFVIFLANDIYGFYNWRRMKKAQSEKR